MARRNVDLVIKARDEATRAIEQITTALKAFSGAQTDIQKGATGTKSSLSELGSSLQRLNSAFSGSAMKKVAGEIGEARAKLEALGAKFKDVAGEAVGYTREARASAAATAKFRSEAAQVAASLKTQVAALRESKAAQAATNVEIKKAAGNRDRLVAADRKLNGQIKEQAVVLAAAREKLRGLSEQIAATDNPTKRLSQSFTSAENAVTRAGARLEEFRTTQAVVRTSIDSTVAALDRANVKLAQQESTVARQAKTLTGLTARQKELAGVLSASASAQGKLERSARSAVSSLEREDTALADASAELQRMESAAQGTAGALHQVAGAVRGSMLRAFGEQRQEVKKAQVQWAAAQATVRELGVQMKAATAPSEALVASFMEAKQAARLAKAEFEENRGVLHALRSVLRETGGDVGTLAGQIQRMESILQRGNKALSDRKKRLKDLAAAERQETQAARQASSGNERLAASTRAVGVAQGKATKQTLTFSAALRKFYGNSRTALSFTQRLRSEVLALVLAYGGLFAVFQGVTGVVDAFNQLEAAQNRLNVVFEGDQSKITAEIQFLREEARRLGIEFGTLALEYTKFAVATKGTNLAGRETRRIFSAVAEAGRVNKLSLDALKGVFVALSQIVSKGSVQMEELRQQLGDRLPGALQLLADGLQVTTAELIKMIENGQVSSDALSAFADELERKFSGALPAALRSTSAEIGRFQNALFEALLIVGKSKFIETFTQFLRDFTEELQSADAIAFLERMGVVLAELTEVLGVLVRNFDLVVIAITAFVASRLAPFLVVLIGRFVTLNTTAVSTRRIMLATAADMGRLTTSTGKAAVAVRGVTMALRGMLSATGIGLAITLIAAAIGGWAASADTASEALAAHREIVEQVKQAYFEAEGNVGLFVEAVREITTATSARAALRALVEETDELRGKLDALTLNNFSDEFRASAKGLPLFPTDSFQGFRDILDALDDGAISADAMVAAFDALAETTDDVSEEVEAKLLAMAEAYRDFLNEQKLGRAVIAAAKGETEAFAAAMDDAAGETDAQARAMRLAADRAKKYGTAMQTLAAVLPGAADEMERLQKAADLEAAFNSAVKHAGGIREVQEAWEAWRKVLRGIASEDALGIFGGKTGSSLEQSMRLLQGLEGFQGTGKFDVNAQRGGFGSDTITLSDGTIKAVTEGMAISMEDALRDLVRRIGEFQSVIKGQIGGGRFAQFSSEQQAALTSIAYNYGRLPQTLVEAVKSGTERDIADAIRRLAGDNGGVNSKRRGTEAAIFESAPIDIAGFAALEEARAKAREKEAKAAEQRREATAKAIADGGFAISQQELLNAKKEREAAILEAVRAAREANKDITAGEIEQIRKQAAALFDLQHAGDALEAQKKRAAEAEREVNNLLTIRTQLTEQIKLLEDDGQDNDATNRARAGLEEVNEQLLLAIERSLLLYQALGGTEADAAIAKLQTLKLTLDSSGKKALVDFKKVKDLFATGFVKAVDSFSQAVANGEKATKALLTAFRQFASDFLRQIAQMILKQIVLNALKAIGGNPLGFGVGHSGGMVSSLGNRKRHLAPGAFANAMRFHGGGIAGIGPDETPIIAQKTEEILTDDDPRHRNNLGRQGASSGGGGFNGRIINAVDGSSLLEEALASPQGEEVILNYLRANPSAVRAAIGA